MNTNLINDAIMLMYQNLRVYIQLQGNELQFDIHLHVQICLLHDGGHKSDVHV